MTNLADLLPAGGGQNNTEFVADGNISAGAPVILTAAGKAAPISGSSDSVGSSAIFGGDPYYPAVTYDTANDKVVVAYRDEGDSGYAKMVVGTVSGTSISWGTPLSLAIVAGYATLDVTYDVNSGKVVVAVWNSLSSEGLAGVCTVSGTSISVGTLYTFNNANTEDININYDSNAQKCVISYSDQGNSAYGTAIVATVSGTALSFGSEAVFASGTVQPLGAAFDSTSNKMIFAYRKNSVGTACVGTVSGTSISFGSEVEFDSGEAYDISVAHDVSQNKNLIAYRDVSNSNYGTGIVGTVSGTSISFGTGVVFESAYVRQVNAVYDSNNTKTVIGYVDDGNSYYGTAVSATISGTTVSFTDPYVWLSGRPGFLGAGYDPGTNQVIFAYRDNNNSNQGTGICFTPGATNLTSTNLLGLAPEAISDTATGTINTWGSRCESASLSLAAALRFGTSAVFESANAGVITETFDSTNNKVVVAYKDSGNSNYGTAAVGTLSGSSISFGTPAVFESAEVGELSAAFDSNENRVVISYRDAGNSNYGTAVVGEVSGTSISFGTPATFSGTNSAYNTSTAFDSSNNKIVVSYRDTSNSNYGTAAVGTVSGASITFGTPVVYSAAATTNYGSITYDSTSNQIVLCYQSGVDEKAIVGAVSGTSISFGAEATVESSAAPGHRSVAFDSTNNRVVDTYANGSTGYCTSAIGTVSGTSISFGTPVIADTASTGYLGSAFDVSSGKIVIVYNASASGLANTGTVSGTTITFGDKVTFLSGDPNHVGAVYDSNANRVVVSYSDATNSNYGTSITASSGTVPLTVATDYYVQTDGTLSTDTGGQLIGKAITATQINIKDYTG